MDKEYKDLDCFSRETAYAIIEASVLIAEEERKRKEIALITKALKRLAFDSEFKKGAKELSKELENGKKAKQYARMLYAINDSLKVQYKEFN